MCFSLESAFIKWAEMLFETTNQPKRKMTLEWILPTIFCLSQQAEVNMDWNFSVDLHLRAQSLMIQYIPIFAFLAQVFINAVSEDDPNGEKVNEMLF